MSKTEELSDYDKLIQEQSDVTSADETSAAQTSTKDEEEKKPDQVDEEKADGIATPDGKRIIPFSRLNEEIQARVKAEQELAELNQRIEQAMSQGTGVANLQIPKEALDRLAEMREYDEEGANLLEQAMKETLTQAQSYAQKAAQYELAQQKIQQTQAAQEQARQQAIIETYPNLKEIQQDPVKWKQAETVFHSLFDNPQTAALSEADKIAKVNDVISVLYSMPNSETKQPATPKETAKQQKQPATTVNTLSDLGAGAVPQNSFQTGELREDMSTSDFVKFWQGKSLDDADSFLK